MGQCLCAQISARKWDYKTYNRDMALDGPHALSASIDGSRNARLPVVASRPAEGRVYNKLGMSQVMFYLSMRCAVKAGLHFVGKGASLCHWRGVAACRLNEGV